MFRTTSCYYTQRDNQ